MTSPKAIPKPAIWSVPECPFVIETAAEVLDRIHSRGQEGLRAAPIRGIEIGGILLGSFVGGRLIITDCEPFSSEYANGPSFLLSERDRMILASRVRIINDHAAGPKVVGWYHSRSRPALEMSPGDIETHNECFPEAWQVLLLARALPGRPGSAAYFFRDGNGQFHTTPAAHHLFGIPGDAPLPDAGGDEPALPAVRKSAAPAPIRTYHIYGDTPRLRPRGTQFSGMLPEPESHLKRRAGWIAAAVLGLATVGMGASYLRDFLRPNSEVPTYPLKVEVIEKGDQFVVHWDPGPLKGPVKGLLTISEGAVHNQIPLDAPAALSGVATYIRRSEVTGFSLRFENQEGVVWKDSVTYVGAPAAPAPAETARAAGEVKPEDLQPAQPKPEQPRPEQPRPEQPRPETLQAEAPTPEPPKTTARRFVLNMKQELPSESPSMVDAPPASGTPAVVSEVQLPRIAQAPAAAPEAAQPAPVPAPSPLAGSWTLAPGPSRSPDAPESLALTLTESDGAIRGSVDARYKGNTGRVRFNFAGKASPGRSIRVPWTDSNGQRGQIELIRLPGSPERIEVVFYANGSQEVYDHIVKRQ